MAVPPTYVDLGKSAKDVFTKGYGKQRRANCTQLFHQPLQQCDIEEKGLNRKWNMMCAASENGNCIMKVILKCPVFHKMVLYESSW